MRYEKTIIYCSDVPDGIVDERTKERCQASETGASAMKSMIPGSKQEEPEYRLIKKTYQGKESLIFVDFTKILDKILVAYETVKHISHYY